MVKKRTIRTLIPKALSKRSLPKPTPFKDLILPNTRNLQKSLFGVRKRKHELRQLFIKSQKILHRRFKSIKYHPKTKKSKKIKKIKVRRHKVSIVDAQGSKTILSTRISPQISGKSILTSYYPLRLKTSRLINVKISNKGKKELNIVKAGVFGRRKFRNMLEDIAIEMNIYLESMIVEAARKIAYYVPRETGDLQVSLLNSMNSNLSTIPQLRPTRISQLELIVGIYSDIPYAQYVDRPKRTPYVVKHYKSQGKMGRRSGEFLHDPNAVKAYISILMLHLKPFARRFGTKMIRNLARRWKLNHKIVRPMFKFIEMGKGI